MDLGNCRSSKCNAPIRWARTTAGKRIPLDREPLDHQEAYAESRGVFYLDDFGVATAWAPGLIADVGELYRAHWATCRDKEAFRK